jgi:hypothetical protein
MKPTQKSQKLRIIGGSARWPQTQVLKTTNAASAQVQSAVEIDISSVEVDVASADTRKVDIRPHLPCEPAGHKGLLLMDSGADCALISQTLFDKLKDSCKTTTVPAFTIITADGNKCRSDKSISIPVKAGKKLVTIQFRSFPTLQRDAILGVDSLYKLNARLYFPDEDANNSEEVPAIECAETSLEDWLQVADDTNLDRTDQEIEFERRIVDCGNPIRSALDRALELRGRQHDPQTLPDIIANIDSLLHMVSGLHDLPITDGYTIALEQLSGAPDTKPSELETKREVSHRQPPTNMEFIQVHY